MADLKISAAPAVVTPLGTDEYATNQGGVSKKTTLSQIEAALSITASQVSDFDTEVSNNASVVANTAKVTNATHTGDVTGDTALTIAADAVTYAKMQNVVANNVLLGNIAGAGGIVAELTGANVNTILPNFTDALDGLAPASGGGITNFLRADGTWTAPAGGGDVTKVGTPVDNQVGVWTGDGTIEGTAGLTFDGTQLVVPTGGGPIAPAIAFGDGDTGLYENIPNAMRMAFSGADALSFSATAILGLTTDSFQLDNSTASGTNPTLRPNASDGNTGIGSAGADQLSLIAGGAEGGRIEALQATFGNYVFDTDQAVGVGQDNFVLTYDNAGGQISLEVIPTHTGQVTGDTDLSLDITAITDQPASGALVGADTFLTNDGGVLSESTMTQLLAFIDANAAFPFPEYHWGAVEFNNPNNSDWEITNLAPAVIDSNDNALTIRAFDDTQQEAVGLQFQLPVGATEMTLQWVSRAETAPGAAAVAKPELFYHDIPDNAAVPANPWSSFSMNDTDIPTNEFFQYDSQTITFSTLSLTAGEYVQMQFCRDPGHVNDNLTGDWNLLSLNVSFA